MRRGISYFARANFVSGVGLTILLQALGVQLSPWYIGQFFLFGLVWLFTDNND